MGFDKIKCYICQTEFADKETVIRHIRARHPDHTTNRIWRQYLEQEDVSKINTQMDVIKSTINNPVTSNVQAEKVREIAKTIVSDEAINKDNVKRNDEKLMKDTIEVAEEIKNSEDIEAVAEVKEEIVSDEAKN